MRCLLAGSGDVGLNDRPGVQDIGITDSEVLGFLNSRVVDEDIQFWELFPNAGCKRIRSNQRLRRRGPQNLDAPAYLR